MVAGSFASTAHGLPRATQGLDIVIELLRLIFSARSVLFGARGGTCAENDRRRRESLPKAPGGELDAG